MASHPSMGDPSPAGRASSELRRSVEQASERIHEIIDAAERVAVEIRSEAEVEAESYMAERRREADRLVAERTAALDQLSLTVADIGERFKQRADQMLSELDQVVAEARRGAYRNAPLTAVEPEPAPREPEPQPAVVSAYPGRDVASTVPEGAVAPAATAAVGDADTTAEALLRATQMAVTGKDRDEIARALRTDFPAVDADSILDQILG
jgi:hypothetical protein